MRFALLKTARTALPRGRRGIVLGASAAVTALGGVLTACPRPGGCLQCGLCAGILPMAAVSLLLFHVGKRR